jgi:hypothetical protein
MSVENGDWNGGFVSAIVSRCVIVFWSQLSTVCWPTTFSWLDLWTHQPFPFVLVPCSICPPNYTKTASKATTPSLRTLSALSPGQNVVVPLITDSLEWTLSSPPPLHQFDEPPLIVECEHLAIQPGAEVEDVLEKQGETVTDIVGKEGWVANDPALYEGLIPQNVEWTEFIDEKTGEWVYLDEFGQRVEKPKA